MAVAAVEHGWASSLSYDWTSKPRGRWRPTSICSSRRMMATTSTGSGASCWIQVPLLDGSSRCHRRDPMRLCRAHQPDLTRRRGGRSEGANRVQGERRPAPAGLVKRRVNQEEHPARRRRRRKGRDFGSARRHRLLRVRSPPAIAPPRNLREESGKNFAPAGERDPPPARRPSGRSNRPDR